MTGDRDLRAMENKDHSKAYTAFFRHLNANGKVRAYGGFAPDTLDKLYDWERDEVEETIWTRFKFSGEGDLAMLVSKLQKYDGIEALNERLSEGLAGSEYSMRMVFVAAAAYDATLIEDYLDYIFEYYDKKQDYASLSVLSYLKPCDKLYGFFTDVYLNSSDSTARMVAVDGLLNCKGYFENPMDLEERSTFDGMTCAFLSDDPELRKKKLARFENGEFDNIPRTEGSFKIVPSEEAIRMAKEQQKEEDPGELVTGVIDATESRTYIVFYEPENRYIPSDLSEELDIKPAVGDKVRLLKKKRGRGIIMSIEA